MRGSGGEIFGLKHINGSTDFGWLTADYVHTRGGQERIQRIVALLTEHLGTNGVVLDIGCGSGRIAGSLTAENRKIVAIDLSDSMARAAYDALRGSVIRADAQSLPFANESVDAALMIWVINHVSNPFAAIQDVHRVLRPGGRLLYLSGIPIHPDWDVLGKILKRLDRLRQESVQLERNFRNVAEQIGFKVLHEKNHVVCFRQRPSGLAARIEGRLYGHLRYLDHETWERDVTPTIDALTRMPNTDEYRERQNRHAFIVFEKTHHMALDDYSAK